MMLVSITFNKFYLKLMLILLHLILHYNYKACNFIYKILLKFEK